MSSAGSGFQIIETDDWDRAIAAIGTHPKMDSVLQSIMYALNRNPIGFPLVQAPDIHLAKTKIRITGRSYIPSYRMWFRVDQKIREVHLLWIDVCPPEDMGFGNIFDDSDDDIPF